MTYVKPLNKHQDVVLVELVVADVVANVSHDVIEIPGFAFYKSQLYLLTPF
jgi:hypothetical protein